MRIEEVEGEVLELGLDPRHAEPVRQRPVDLERLLRDAPARLGRHVIERLHVVQPIGDLDQDDPQVARRGQDQLAEGLGLGLVAADVLVLADLGDAVDQRGDLLAELGGEILASGAGVLEHVVQQRRSRRRWRRSRGRRAARRPLADG